jgi:hypothetical protein
VKTNLCPEAVHARSDATNSEEKMMQANMSLETSWATTDPAGV